MKISQVILVVARRCDIARPPSWHLPERRRVRTPGLT